MTHYTHKMSFWNQNLQWQIYIRPYFTYIAPFMKNQNKTVNNLFMIKFRASYKMFMGIPLSFRNENLKLLLEDSILLTERALTMNLNKIKERFNSKHHA
jgi:hypothetical protein